MCERWQWQFVEPDEWAAAARDCCSLPPSVSNQRGTPPFTWIDLSLVPILTHTTHHSLTIQGKHAQALRRSYENYFRDLVLGRVTDSLLSAIIRKRQGSLNVAEYLEVDIRAEEKKAIEIFYRCPSSIERSPNFARIAVSLPSNKIWLALAPSPCSSFV